MSDQPAPARFQISALLQVLLSLFGLVTSLGGAAILLLLTLFSSGAGSFSTAGYTEQFISLSWNALFTALLCLPALGYALTHLLHLPRAQGISSKFSTVSAAMLLWPLLLFGGSQLSRMGGAGQSALGFYILPVFTILASALPLWWLVELTRRGIPCEPRRSWGALIFALFISNPLTMLLEIVLLVGLAVGVSLLLSSSAVSAYFLARIQNIFQQALEARGDPASIQQLILPLLSNPWVIFAGVSLFSGFVPLLEELCKSLAVWALLGRRLNPGEGLVVGAVAGAGFALTETLTGLANASISDQWLTLVVGRAGTGLLHVSTAALVGLGLATAWRSGKFHHFALSYFSAVALHGLWNFFSLGSGLAPIVLSSRSAGQAFSIFSLSGMLVLALAFILILLNANTRARRASRPSPAHPITL